MLEEEVPVPPTGTYQRSWVDVGEGNTPPMGTPGVSLHLHCWQNVLDLCHSGGSSGSALDTNSAAGNA